MKHLFAAAALALALPAAAQEAEEPVTPSAIVAAAGAEEWLAIAPDDLLVMELAPDARGNPRTVVIQLMPPPFSQPWVENVRRLAAAHWWDGTSVYRVQDNYVTQWGDVTEAKALPEGVFSPEMHYSLLTANVGEWCAEPDCRAAFQATAPRDLVNRMSQNTVAGLRNTELTESHVLGWPIASNREEVWPIHCYGNIGVARDYAPDTGTGAELYTIIGQPQRHMDRNLAVVGRVIEGMEHLSSLPRGSGELGFYTDEEAELRTPILSVRLASELEEPPAFEYLDTTSESFARYVAVRANRNDPFYTVPAGGVDVCSVQVPVRRVAD